MTRLVWPGLNTPELQHPSQEEEVSPCKNQPAKSTAPCFPFSPCAVLSIYPSSAFPRKSEHFKMFSHCVIQQPSTKSKLPAPCEELSYLHTQSKTNPDLKQKGELPQHKQTVFRFPKVSGIWIWRWIRSITTGKLQTHDKHDELDGLFKGRPNTTHQHVSASPVIPLTWQFNQMIPYVQQRVWGGKGPVAHMWLYKDISLFWFQNKNKFLTFGAHARSVLTFALLLLGYIYSTAYIRTWSTSSHFSLSSLGSFSIRYHMKTQTE